MARGGYRAVEYVEDVHQALAAATVALVRGGASTLAEVAAMRVPCFVAPYPGHVHAVLVSEWGINSLPEWDDLAEGGTTLHILKASHHNLWNPPQDQDLADVLNACLTDLPDLLGGGKGA